MSKEQDTYIVQGEPVTNTDTLPSTQGEYLTLLNQDSGKIIINSYISALLKNNMLINYIISNYSLIAPYGRDLNSQQMHMAHSSATLSQG